MLLRIDFTNRYRVIAQDSTWRFRIDGHKSLRYSLVLVLPGESTEPIVKLGSSAIEPASLVVSTQRLNCQHLASRACNAGALLRALRWALEDAPTASKETPHRDRTTRGLAHVR